TVDLPTTEIIEPFFTVQSIKIRFSSFHLPELKGIFLMTLMRLLVVSNLVLENVSFVVFKCRS
ncbi:TPA: hypothetical protein ACGO4D_002214, partial [Streptococcus suis]